MYLNRFIWSNRNLLSVMEEPNTMMRGEGSTTEKSFKTACSSRESIAQEVKRMNAWTAALEGDNSDEIDPQRKERIDKVREIEL